MSNGIAHDVNLVPRNACILRFEIICQSADQLADLKIHIEMAF